jgi:hypothetical protein
VRRHARAPLARAGRGNYSPVVGSARFRPAALLAFTALWTFAPAAIAAPGVAVNGSTLEVQLGKAPSEPLPNAVLINPLDGGGVIVSFHGFVSQGDKVAGAGCQQVSSTDAGSIGPAITTPQGQAPFPGSGSAHFAATCTLDGVRVIEGRLENTTSAQGWISRIDLPTTVDSLPKLPLPPPLPGNAIVTGAGGDRITGSTGADVIDAGGAPYKGQEAFPPSGTPALDDPNRNVIDGEAGGDSFLLSHGTGRDIVTGGAGIDVVTYSDRFGIGAPGAAGVNVSLDGQANDGDPQIDPPDSAAAGEGDNIGADVEDVIGTKREDHLVGSNAGNVLTGGEGVDTLVGNAGEDTLLAREPIAAGSGLRDVLSCGSPSPFTKGSLGLLGIIATVSGTDRLEADLADVKPADCEELVDMAVDEPAPVAIARSAHRVRGGNLAARLTCPRAAHRTCRGTLRLAGKRPGSKSASFVLGRGVTRKVRLRLKRAAKAAIRHGHPHVRLVSRERGLKGRIERVALVRVR